MTEPEGAIRDPIRDGLRRLPRTVASDDFTPRLIERLHRGEPRAPLWPRLAAAAMLLIALAAGLTAVHRHKVRAGQEQRRAALELHHQELRRELADLRELAVRAPTLYLGSASDFDLVLDLEPWMEQPLAVQPAAYTSSRP